MTPNTPKEWEQMRVAENPRRGAVLYRTKSTGKVNWSWADIWRQIDTRDREVLKRTTAQEAFNLKWLAYEDRQK